MLERAVHEGMVHLVHRVNVGFDSNFGCTATHPCRVHRVIVGLDVNLGCTATHPCVRFLCSGLFSLEKNALFVHDDVDCMTCLVRWNSRG